MRKELLTLLIIFLFHEFGHIFAGTFFNWEYLGVVIFPDSGIYSMIGIKWDYGPGNYHYYAMIIGYILIPLFFTSNYLLLAKKSYKYWIFSIFLLRGDIFSVITTYQWFLENGLV